MIEHPSVKHIPELCPVVETIRALGSESKLMVIRHLSVKGMGFNELLRAADLNSKTLSHTLKSLESDGIVERAVISTRPFKVRYTLTAKGEDIGPVLDTMGTWGEKWLHTADAPELIAK